jgi:hypothetical protein
MRKTNPKKQSVVKMPLVNPDAASIDVGDTIHAVAVPEAEMKIVFVHLER